MEKSRKLDWSLIWNQHKGRLGSALLDWLNKKATKTLLKKLAIASGGFRAWLVSFVVEEIVEEVDEHIIEPVFRKIGYEIEVKKGNKVYRKVLDATDIDSWVDAHRDV